MSVKKGSHLFQNTFDDSKQFYMPDGRPFESIPVNERAIHQDDTILRGLAASVLVQAVQDWQKLNKGERKIYSRAEGGGVWRHELLRFFNWSFCGDILQVFVPELTQEEALMNMASLDFNRRQIGIGMGRLSDVGFIRKQKHSST